MSYPVGWDLVNITGTYIGRNGVPCVGSVTLSSPQLVLRSGTIVPAADIVFDLVNGTFSGQIPATDDPNASPVGWTYTVTENVPGGRQGYQIVAPHTSPGIDLSTVVPVTMPQPPTYGFPYVTLAQLASTSTGQGIALIGWPAGFGITVAPTNQFFEQNGAAIHRFNDRMFIAGATANDGSFPNVNKDWLTSYQNTLVIYGGSSSPPPAVVNATCAVLNSLSGAGGETFVSGAQTANFTSASGTALGISAYGVCNNQTYSSGAWAYYGEAHRTAGATGTIIGMEIDTHSVPASIVPTPYAQGDVIGIQVASGAGVQGGVNGSAGIQIVANPTPWYVGIAFDATAINGTNGVTGTGIAIAMAKGHAIQWYATGGVLTSNIYCSGTTNAGGISLAFQEGSAQFLNSGGGQLLAAFPVVANAANYLYLSAATTGGAPEVAVAGSDPNIDLLLNMKGTGVLKFGGSGSITANGTVATAMSSLGPTGSHTTIQEWLTIKNNSGTIRYIPCF